MRDPRKLDDAPPESARERQDLADLASQTMGIPRRQALRLADRYLLQPGGRTSFLAWIARPAAEHRNASRFALTHPVVAP